MTTTRGHVFLDTDMVPPTLDWISLEARIAFLTIQALEKSWSWTIGLQQFRESESPGVDSFGLLAGITPE